MAKLLSKLPHGKLFLLRKRKKSRLKLSPAVTDVTAIISQAQLDAEEFSVNKGTSWTAFVHVQTNFHEPLSGFGSHLSPPQRTSRSLLAQGLTCVDDGWPGFHIHSTSCLSGLEQPHQGLGCEDTGSFADLQRSTLTETKRQEQVPAALPLPELIFRDSFIICSQFLSANLIFFFFFCSSSPSLKPQ